MGGRGFGGGSAISSFNGRLGVITLTSQDVTDALGYTPGSLAFSTISVSGQSDIVADSGTDTLTLVGSGVTITTNAATDTITFTASSGLTVGTTVITNGTSGRILYDNGGVVGEMTTTGTGTILMLAASPTTTGTLTGAAATFSGAVSTGILTCSTSGATGALVVTSSSSSNGISMASLLAASAASTGDIYFSVGKSLNTAQAALIGFSTTGSANGFAFLTLYGQTAKSLSVGSAGQVGVNSLDSAAQFSVTTPAAGTIGQIIKAAASRTAELIKYQTSAGSSLGNGQVGCVADIIATTSTTHTDGTFDTLSTITFVANSLIVNGDKHYFDFTLTTVSSVTASRDFKLAFGGITIFDSTALVFGAGAGVVRIWGYISRVTSTTCEATITYDPSGSATILGQKQNKFTGPDILLGMTLTGTNNLVLSAAAAGTGAASGDISVVHGTARVEGFGS